MRSIASTVIAEQYASSKLQEAYNHAYQKAHEIKSIISVNY